MRVAGTAKARASVHAQAQRGKEFFAQYFSRVHRAHAVDGAGQGATPSVVIDDLGIGWALLAPDKAQPPLIVDADAVLVDAIAPERLQPWRTVVA